jgi:hypothetical protein
MPAGNTEDRSTTNAQRVRVRESCSKGALATKKLRNGDFERFEPNSFVIRRKCDYSA